LNKKLVKPNLHSRYFRWITVLVFGISLQLSAQSNSNPPDIYKRLDSLWNWILTYEYQEFEKEILDFSAPLEFLFPNYELDIEPMDNTTNVLSATLPQYLGVLSSKLFLTTQFINDSTWTFDFQPPIKYISNKVICDDSMEVETDGQLEISHLLLEEINKKTVLFRTIGLSSALHPNILDGKEVKMYFHSHDVESISYNKYEEWLQIIQAISYNKLVHSGPISINTVNDSVSIRYYLSITSLESTGLHFLTIEEYYQNSNNSFSPLFSTVHFFPYIRIDNLSSLYGGSMNRGDNVKYPIHINKPD